MTTASLSRRILTGLLGLTIAGGLAACAPMPSLPGPGGQNPGGQVPGQSSGGEFSTDLSGGITVEDTYEGETAPLYQKQGVMCMPDWVAVPSGAPVLGQYMEWFPDSTTKGAAICANAWDAASAAGISQSLPAKSAEAMPGGKDFEMLRVAMAGRIDTAFRNPLITATTLDQLRDIYVSEHGAQVDAYGDEGRTLIVIAPAADDPTSVGVVFGVLCSGRC